jgi:HAE1 family hydrophobic/amphiphilic exporter-1
MYGPDTEQLYSDAARLEGITSHLPGLVDVSSDLQIKNPQIEITIDRDRAASLGVDWMNFASALYNAYGPQLVSPFTERTISIVC